MTQIAWNSTATIVPYGNKPQFSGTLATCLAHWRDQLNPVDQVTCFITIDTPIDGKACLEPEDIAMLVGGFMAPKEHSSH